MSTKALIAELTIAARPVKRIACARVCTEALAVMAVSLALLTALQGLRADFYARIAEPLFAAELALNALLILVAGCAATAFAFPDRARAPLLKPALLFVFVGYSLLTLLSVVQTPDLAGELAHSTPHGLECLLCILSFALTPAGFLFWRLRQLASIKPMYTGGAALMMAVATGCLGVRLVESEIVSTGLILWHYAPLLVLSLMGLVLGRKIFRW